ncbi:MAG TPA: hypothetical protein VFF11_16145 [Candidatus Binatia bacterium]|nr:hypothetical protein [Candidatus Binatia bacterium]
MKRLSIGVQFTNAPGYAQHVRRGVLRQYLHLPPDKEGRIHTLFLVGDGALRRPRRVAAQSKAAKEEKRDGLREFRRLTLRSATAGSQREPAHHLRTMRSCARQRFRAANPAAVGRCLFEGLFMSAEWKNAGLRAIRFPPLKF